MSERHRLVHHYGGWQPSRPDHRRRQADTSGIKVLTEVDPRKDMPLVYDQMQLGSCTGHATEGAFEYDMILDGKLQPGKGRAVSAMDIYWLERQREGSLGQGDTGALGHDAFIAAKQHGICAEKDWPYSPQSYNDPAYYDPSSPPRAAQSDARYYRLTKPYAAVHQTQSVFQQALSNRQTIAFGFSVYESFESPDVARTGIVPMPSMYEQQVGGHEVLLVGYLKSEPHYGLVRNSWSADWGIGGYFLMPWTYILDSNLAGDWITIQRPIGK